MDNLNSHIDLYLTEISIELLGNKIYDINGKSQDKLINLFKALPTKGIENKNENSNDFMCSLGYQNDFTNDVSLTEDFLNDQFDFVLKDANTSPKVDQQIIEQLRMYKMDQKRLVAEVSDLRLGRVVEKGKLISHLNRSRVVGLSKKKTNADKLDLLKKYYANERNDLLKMGMDTLRLMKYIINDSHNEELKGELIGTIHAMRSVKDIGIRFGNPSRPYSLPKGTQPKKPQP